MPVLPDRLVGLIEGVTRGATGVVDEYQAYQTAVETGRILLKRGCDQKGLPGLVGKTVSRYLAENHLGLIHLLGRVMGTGMTAREEKESYKDSLAMYRRWWQEE